ncbi:MAG: serine protease [Candidatus Komeilibacteria bacterium]|nr:serine protease [Candidatus Komeilibacteria bacterium]
MEEKHKHFARPTSQRPPSMFNLTLWTILVGLIAGFGGYLLANYILPSDSANYFNISNPNRDIKVSIEQPLTNFGDDHQKSIAGIYKILRAVSPSVGQPLFSADNFLGSAVVVTSDGWLMTTNQVVANNQVSVILGDKVYEVEELLEDEFSSTVFLKINEASLQPVDFQLIDDIKVGEKLFTMVDVANSYDHLFATTYLSNAHYSSDKYLYTDVVDYYVKITGENLDSGAPYFNLDGNLIGLSYIMSDETVLLPSEYLRQAVKHLLNDTERPRLGIRYVDMENNSGFERKGSLVYNPQYAAVVYNSPAYKAGIKSGDQIVAINNDIVSSYRTLTAVLQSYRLGDKVLIKILRKGVEQDIEVSL